MDQMPLFDTADIPTEPTPWRLNSLNTDDPGADITPLPTPDTTRKDAA